MTVRLALTRALESSGMQSEAPERIATEIYDAIHDNVADAWCPLDCRFHADVLLEIANA